MIKRNMKPSINIHISKLIMAKIYYELKETKHMTKEQIDRELSYWFLYACAFHNNITGDVYINLERCSNNIMISRYGHKDKYGHIAATLSHEFFHNILIIEQNESTSFAFDNIADKLERDGYLGG